MQKKLISLIGSLWEESIKPQNSPFSLHKIFIQKLCSVIFVQLGYNSSMQKNNKKKISGLTDQRTNQQTSAIIKDPMAVNPMSKTIRFTTNRCKSITSKYIMCARIVWYCVTLYVSYFLYKYI